MGVAYYLTTDCEASRFAVSVDGKALARFSDQLDRIAKKVGVKPLTAFLHVPLQDALDLLEGEDDAPAEDSLPQEGPWFEAGEGLTTIDGLLEAIQTGAKASIDPEWTHRDLSQLREALVEARSSGYKWRLEIDF